MGVGRQRLVYHCSRWLFRLLGPSSRLVGRKGLLCLVANLGYRLLLLLHHPGLIHRGRDRGYCIVEGGVDLGFHLPGFLVLVVLLPAVSLCLACLVLLHFAPVFLVPIVVLDRGL